MTIADRLAAALRAGELLDLLPEIPAGDLLEEAEMRGWDSDHDIDAGLLRRLLRNKDGDADPRGLRVRGARILGRLDLDYLIVPIGLLLVDCLLDDGITAEQAHVPRLELQRCRISHAGGPPLHAARLHVDGRLKIRDSVITGASVQGAVCLVGARIGGELSFRGATLHNRTGLALLADRLQTDGSVFLDRGFTAEGEGALGAVRLVRARIGGELSLRGATLHNRTGPALAADRLRIDEDLYLDQDFTAEGAGDRGVVRLSGAEIKGYLSAGSRIVCSNSEEHRWYIDSLTYKGVPRLALEENRAAWLKLLRTGTSAYAAQPYQQLAAAYRAEGHDSDVRAILIAQREDQLARGGLSWPDRWWGRMTGVLLRYGYQPWRALLYLAGVLGISVALACVLGGQGGLARTTRPTTPPATAAASATIPATEPCTLVQTIGRGLDLGAPFLPIAPAAAGSCQPTATPAGDALTISRWILQLAAWALAALFIAGFTGIVRKT